ncbi:unnamed protein product [Allacma fusca]|uniref:Uncharacterized protein n=1 Tax=Allacma fusca TaxID=39272 RepID=A0A8J2P0Y8_9HEXA|nr:unnamed protein product [Allacma fusca]
MGSSNSSINGANGDAGSVDALCPGSVSVNIRHTPLDFAKSCQGLDDFEISPTDDDLICHVVEDIAGDLTSVTSETVLQVSDLRSSVGGFQQGWVSGGGCCESEPNKAKSD